jgi:serine/threonine protein kinase
LLGINNLHSQRIVHRDLKLENILLDDPDPNKLTLKIADFGFARKIPDGEKEELQCGTPIYMAYEIIEGRDILGLTYFLEDKSIYWVGSMLSIDESRDLFDNSINNFINPAAPWKRLGAKSLPDLLLLPDYVNYSAKNIQLEKDFPQDGERTCSGGLLLSSFSQQLHYEYLKPFRSTLECAQMLRKIKKLSSRIYSII